MNERSRVLGATLLGAAIGGLVGYLYLAGSGRRLLDKAESKLDEVAGEFRKLRRTLSRAQAVASEGWGSVQELTTERRPPDPWPVRDRQSRPL